MPTENERDELAKAIRQTVRLGSIGPNAEAIIESGGTVALTYEESEDAADRLLPWLAEKLEQAFAAGHRQMQLRTLELIDDHDQIDQHSVASTTPLNPYADTDKETS